MERLKTFLTAFFGLLKGFFSEWNEFITVPLSLLLFALGGLLIRSVDPTSGLYDAGIFQAILFAVAAFLLLHGVAWFVIKITLPGMFRFLSDDLEGMLGNGSDKLTPVQKCAISLLYLFACLLGLLLILKMLF